MTSSPTCGFRRIRELIRTAHYIGKLPCLRRGRRQICAVPENLSQRERRTRSGWAIGSRDALPTSTVSLFFPLLVLLVLVLQVLNNTPHNKPTRIGLYLTNKAEDIALPQNRRWC